MISELRRVDKTTKLSSAKDRIEGLVARLEERSGKSVPIGKTAIGTVYLAIDCSGSMDGAKLDEAKRGAIQFSADALAKGYASGIVTFASNAKIVRTAIPAPPISETDVGDLIAAGSTNMAEAIIAATDLLKGQRGHKVICIVSDGRPDSESETLLARDSAKAIGIEIMVIAVDEADDLFLQKLATTRDLFSHVAASQIGDGLTAMTRLLPG